MSFALMSPAYANGQVPPAYTCEGRDVSPPLSWQDAPPGTRSLALVIDDPDAPDPAAPRTVWVHWVVYNLPAQVTSLPEATTGRSLPEGAREGKNDWKEQGYRGPCPPVGRHRYIHHLYALDIMLPDLGAPTKADLQKAIQGHVLAKAELTATYQKSSK